MTEYFWTDETQQAVIRVDDFGNVVAYFPGDAGYDDAAAQVTGVAGEITKRKPFTAEEMRAERDKLLAECDYRMVPDAPWNTSAWATYRQALRDVTLQPGFPDDITWPQTPSA